MNIIEPKCAYLQLTHIAQMNITKGSRPKKLHTRLRPAPAPAPAPDYWLSLAKYSFPHKLVR